MVYATILDFYTYELGLYLFVLKRKDLTQLFHTKYGIQDVILNAIGVFYTVLLIQATYSPKIKPKLFGLFTHVLDNDIPIDF